MQSRWGESKLEFRQIVLEHLKKILEISSSELRDKTIIRNHGTFTETIENEDTRLSYLQSIENLAYILLPYFDEEMKNVYDKCIKIVNNFDYEVKIILKETYEKICKDSGKKDLGKTFVLEMKLKYAKELFVALNLLLNRNNYLKTAVYGEGVDEVVYGDDDAYDDEEN